MNTSCPGRGNWNNNNRFGRNFRFKGRGSWKPYSRGQSSNRGGNYRGRNERNYEHEGNFHSPENIEREFVEPGTSQQKNTQEDLTQYCGSNAQIVDTNVQSGPYTGWKLYITEEYEKALSTVMRLKVIENYYILAKLDSNKLQIEEKGSFVLNFKDITKNDSILKVWPDIVKDIENSPQKCINCFGLAMHQIISKALCEDTKTCLQQCGETVTETSLTNIKLPKINAQLVGFNPQLPMKNLKSHYYGKFVSMKGTVIRVSNVKPLCMKLAFMCGKCGKEFVYSQPYGKYTSPAKCASRGCHSQIFNPLRGSPKTETVDWQSIRLQEITDDQKEVGRMPRTIECELMYDLVDRCVPGDVVAVSGIVQVTNSDEGRSKFSKDKCTFLLYILANSISNCQGTDNTCEQGKVAMPVGLDLTIKDLYAVQAIQAEKQLFKLLTASLCPSIYGHEMVKAGLILGLFGGSQKFVNSCNRIPVRGDPHILVVGDPGLGKSQMLQACANVAPRGVYVCGNTTTTSGLTVTLSRESGSGDYALEAGALVLADQGCCCIDEFDKMSNQHHALLEAMEQQTISIAKAGIVCSLPARTSILAAANPVGGHYNKAKTVSENLKMGSALLSRFDLVFILLDKPDQEMDSKLSEHVMALHSRQGQKQNLNLLNFNETQSSSKTSTQMDREKPLVERLKYSQNEECDPIPSQLLRKYIAYACKYVQAKITPEAAEVLQKFYLELRKRLQTTDSTPITTRQLESLIRLTEARARLELRELSTKEDATDVVEIMKHSMIDVWSDNFGLLDLTRSQHGSGMTGRSQAKRFITILTRMAERNNNSLFSTQQMRQIAKDSNINILDFENFLTSLNTQGFLIKKARGIYKLLAVDY